MRSLFITQTTQGNRRIALCTVVGILEDGETYSTELKQRQSPGAGKMGQREHELVCQRLVIKTKGDGNGV